MVGPWAPSSAGGDGENGEESDSEEGVEMATTTEEATTMEEAMEEDTEDTMEAVAITTATVGVALQLKRQHLRPLK